MNKLAKASLATAAGVALLLGGTGTFAVWNDSTDGDGAAIIAAGNLVVDESATAGVWKAGNAVIDIDDYRVSPGDVLVYTKQMRVVAEGDGLTATLSLAEGSITAADSTRAADVALAALLQDEAELTVSGGGAITGTGPTFTLTPGTAAIDEVVTVSVEITFPDGTTAADNPAKTGAVNLSDFTVAVTQTT